jgi:hypothetical protein
MPFRTSLLDLGTATKRLYSQASGQQFNTSLGAVAAPCPCVTHSLKNPYDIQTARQDSFATTKTLLAYSRFPDKPYVWLLDARRADYKVNATFSVHPDRGRKIQASDGKESGRSIGANEPDSLAGFEPIVCNKLSSAVLQN